MTYHILEQLKSSTLQVGNQYLLRVSLTWAYFFFLFTEGLLFFSYMPLFFVAV